MTNPYTVSLDCLVQTGGFDMQTDGIFTNANTYETLVQGSLFGVPVALIDGPCTMCGYSCGYPTYTSNCKNAACRNRKPELGTSEDRKTVLTWYAVIVKSHAVTDTAKDIHGDPYTAATDNQLKRNTVAVRLTGVCVTRPVPSKYTPGGAKDGHAIPVGRAQPGQPASKTLPVDHDDFIKEFDAVKHKFVADNGGDVTRSSVLRMELHKLCPAWIGVTNGRGITLQESKTYNTIQFDTQIAAIIRAVRKGQSPPHSGLAKGLPPPYSGPAKAV